MASGDTLNQFVPDSAHFPLADFATKDFTAAPDPVLDFDDTTDQTAYFKMIMSGQYDGTTAITVVLHWKFTTFVGSQTCDWEVSFYRVGDDITGDSIESYTFATAQTGIFTEASATGLVDYASINFTNAEADGIQPNEMFILRLTRDASQGTQGNPGDCEFVSGEVKLQ